MAARVDVESSSLVLSGGSGTQKKRETLRLVELIGEARVGAGGTSRCTSPVAELHGLGGGRSLVQQGGVGHRQARDVTDHGLVVEERLQATLGDFRLVGCVLSHPERKTNMRRIIAHQVA